MRDLKKKALLVFHPHSFIDDPTRIFRAARFCARYSMSLEKKTEQYLRAAITKEYPALLSTERIQHELVKILQEEDPRRAFQLLSQWRMMKFIHPKLTLTRW